MYTYYLHIVMILRITNMLCYVYNNDGCITNILHIQVVRRGETVRLPCMVDRLEGFVLLWRKDDNIVSVGSQVLDSVSIIYIYII